MKLIELLRRGYELYERLGCEYFIYQGYGHAVCDEAPDFRQRMLDFPHKVGENN